MKLNLGCGGKKYQNYINIDIREGAGDIKWDCSLPLPYQDSSIEEIRMDAFFEHLFRCEAVEMLKNWRNKLKVGGKLIITYLPDFDKVIEQYLNGELCKIREDCSGLDIAYGALFGAPCGSDIGQLHKNVYTKNSIKELLEQTGFNIIILEYCYKHLSVSENEFPLDKYSLWIECMK